MIVNINLCLCTLQMRSHSSDLIPGQRLQGFVKEWGKYRAHKQLMNLIRFGHKMTFENSPKLSPPRNKFATKLPPEQMTVIRKEVDKFLKTGVIRKLTREEAIKCKGFYSQLSAVPKPNNKWRMIIDMRNLNSHIFKKSFKMQGIKDVTTALKPNMFGAVIDISDAYYQ